MLNPKSAEGHKLIEAGKLKQRDASKIVKQIKINRGNLTGSGPGLCRALLSALYYSIMNDLA